MEQCIVCFIITAVCGVIQSHHCKKIKWCYRILRWFFLFVCFFLLQETAVERNILPVGQRYLVQLQRGDVQNVQFWIKYSYVWHCALLFFVWSLIEFDVFFRVTVVRQILLTFMDTRVWEKDCTCMTWDRIEEQWLSIFVKTNRYGE